MVWNYFLVIFALLSGFWLLWQIPYPEDEEVSEPDGGDEARDTMKTVSVIIPARNEEKRIGGLLDSLAGQTCEPLEIIVVDDNSDDNTRAVALSYNRKVIDAGILPDHWLGKPWACWKGALAAKGEILVFLDADTFLSPKGLANILASYQKKGGALSVQPYHLVLKPYEQLSAIFNIIVMMGTNLFTPLGRKIKPKAFFGPCVVCRREDYFALGGHKAVCGRILEDAALGQHFLANNYPVTCLGGRGSISFRMYPGGLGELFEGWSKNFSSGAVSIGFFAFALISVWITGCFSASGGLIKSLVTGSNPGAASLFFLLYGLQITWMLRRIGSFSYYLVLLYPLTLLYFLITFFYSVISSLFLHKVTWKGRRIDPA